ncbi:MAG TPA: hypothetical protein VIF43_02205 [Patescibacteria group bacterium]|jgi:hypothetical protein
MEREPHQSLIERVAENGVETADAAEVCVFALVASPDRALELMGHAQCRPDEALRVISMPPGDPGRREWAVVVPAVCYPFVEEQVRELLKHRAYASKEEVLSMIERRAVGEAR